LNFSNLRRGSLAVVTAVFVLLFSVFAFAVLFAGASGYLGWLMTWTTRAAGFLIVSFGIPATILGNQIHLATRTLQIDIDCTAILIVALYASLVIAYPLSIRTRLLALLVGIPVIAVVNLLRLLGVAVAVEHLGPAAFAFVHDFLFKVGMVLVVVGLWAGWLQMARGHARAK
jgi:exosortase/archaeosortase family protein